MKNLHFKFLFIAFLVATFFLGLIICFNKKYDYAYTFFSKSLCREIAQHLRNNHYIYGTEGCSDRLLKENLIEEYDLPDVVAIGSSFFQGLHKDPFGNSRFFNAWVPGANLEDLWAVLGVFLYYKKDLPKIIILGIDPHYFESESSFLWQGWTFWQYFFYYMHREVLKSEPDSFKKFGKLFTNSLRMRAAQFFPSTILRAINPQILQHNFNMWKKGAQLKNYVALPQFVLQERDDLYHPDGSVSKPLTEDPDISSKFFLKENGDKKIDSHRVDLFKSLITYLLNRGARVYFYLPAWNPTIYNKLAYEKDSTLFTGTENMIRDYAKENNIPVIGSYNSKTVSWDASAFRDDHHVKSEFIMKLFSDFWQNNISEKQ